MQSILTVSSILFAFFHVHHLLHASGQELPSNEDILYGFNEFRDRCTSIGVGRKAMADGSTVTTHNNDCVECDIRITHVPAQDWPAGSKRPISDIRVSYPRYVERGAVTTHGPDYRPELIDASIYNWTETVPIGFIDQVPHTYAYTLGAYAIQNEKQVSIGESTCSSIYFAKPVTAPDGKALLHMESLTEIALERCDSARCAIQTMGDLAVRYGFYGPAWNENIETAQDEAGEALTISDPNEVWMFHIMPDDTGSSAIWVAQRVPDDHITAVANQFVITAIDLADTDNFMGSSNIYEIAEKNNLWSKSSGRPFNFAYVYGTNRHLQGHGCTRRVWRVFTLAAPSLLPFFSPYTDGLASFGYGADLSAPYPFSVKPDSPLTVQNIMNMNRDQYEKSDFDMTANLDAGPFGDPMRYPPISKLRDPVNGINWQEYMQGLGYQRAISLFRTAYSTVTQSRQNLPDTIGAVTWIAPYAPHHSQFVPVYANAEYTPQSLNTGTPYKMDRKANWWIHCLTGNYLSRWYRYTIEDVQILQKTIEANLFAKQKEAEQSALQFLSGKAKSQNHGEARKVITSFANEAAREVLDQWWEFFWQSVSTYRDLYKIIDPHAEDFNKAFRFLTVSRQWMESVGYWGAPGTPPADETAPIPVKPINVPSYDTPQDYKTKYPYGYTAPYGVSSIFLNQQQPSTTTTDSPPSPSTQPTPSTTTESEDEQSEWHHYLLVGAGLAVGLVVGTLFSYYFFSGPASQGYQPIR